MGLPAGSGVLGRLRDRALRAMSARAVAAGKAQRAAARAGIGLDGPERPSGRLIAVARALRCAVPIGRPTRTSSAHCCGEPTRELFDVPQTP